MWGKILIMDGPGYLGFLLLGVHSLLVEEKEERWDQVTIQTRV